MAGLAFTPGGALSKRTSTEELCRDCCILLVLSSNGHIVNEGLAAIINLTLCAVLVAAGSGEGEIDRLLGNERSKSERPPVASVSSASTRLSEEPSQDRPTTSFSSKSPVESFVLVSSVFCAT